jgi:hydroxylaminobenzene mutase
MEYANRRLMFLGMLLFLLGLFTGFAEAHVTNMRMGLAAHLEGVMNGTFLVVLGAIWQHLRLAPGAKKFTFWISIYGTYVNWGTTLLSAILGTAALSPISGAGHSGLPWQESMITVLLLTVAATMILTTLMALWGLRGKASE